jgi:hypothetical protein
MSYIISSAVAGRPFHLEDESGAACFVLRMYCLSSLNTVECIRNRLWAGSAVLKLLHCMIDNTDHRYDHLLAAILRFLESSRGSSTGLLWR